MMAMIRMITMTMMILIMTQTWGHKKGHTSVNSV